MTPSHAPDGADAFSKAARRVVDYLNDHTPLSDWSVSRVAGGEQVHVHVHHEDLIETGNRVPWDESFCRQMTLGAAHVVPDALEDDSYACLPAAGDVRAYVGFPIEGEDGELFGILCGVDSEPLAAAAAVDDHLVQLLSELLSAHLRTARAIDEGRREIELSMALADTDDLTGLMNRRGWDRVVTDAQQRVDAYADPVAVAVIDLDGLKQLNDSQGHAAGDDLLRRTGEALRAAAGPQDRVARYGGDEFTVLTDDVGVTDLPAHFARFTRALADHGVSASLGYSHTGPGDLTVAEAFRIADRHMYDDKRARRAG